LCDGYLAFPKEEATDAQKRKNVTFFRIMVQLPMELQEVICNRVVGKADDLVGAGLKERGFQQIAKAILKDDTPPPLSMKVQATTLSIIDSVGSFFSRFFGSE